MELIIGRQAGGPDDVKVPDQYTDVGRRHAKITIQENDILLEDLDSANGTFVNGVQVRKKLISASDTIALGGTDGYKVDVNSIIEHYNKVAFLNKTDFAEEFNALQKTYSDYFVERNRLKKQSGFKAFIPRIVITLAGMAITFVIPMDSNIRYAVMTVLGLVGGASTLIKGDDLKLQDALDSLAVEYQNKYLCPKCKKKLGLNNSWKMIQSGKVCPQQCGAIYTHDNFVQ
ncbi:MAG: FHA domain-containing protein [Bacteroidota bacterium]